MKKHYLIVLLILPFFINSCGVNSENPAVAAENGSVYFSFPKTNAPVNVTSVQVTFTRQNFEPIVRQLNLTSDSTANLLISSIAVGTWHLRIDAKNSSNEILYTGEADVIIQTNFITQVSLTLNPTGGGVQTGSINIIVNWGPPTVITSSWTDYNLNPMITPTNSYYDLGGVRQGFIIYDDGKYKMFYQGITYSAKAYICYTESIDGRNWVYNHQNPIITPSNSVNSWDCYSVSAGPVIKINGIYHMYYYGWSSSSSSAPWSIGLATSTDCINWVKRSHPVLSSNSANSNQIVPNSIIKIGDYYYLYYTQRNYPNYTVNVAKSLNGIDFMNVNNAPVLAPTYPWESNAVMFGSVIKDGESYKMVYGAGSQNSSSGKTFIGYATSLDGLNWTKSETPIFDNTKTSNNWGVFGIAYPIFIKTDTEYRVYYSGEPMGGGAMRIGMMKKPI